ncbi:flavin reductase family protein [Saccharothrix longispora]|uniref:flavin reductase family protein n=1 Tax=Saccharothrix longispora TaxID=33920 RepID=UPI0028FD9234|nr:flavin reductase family protein [Saccharothrix longispora]MDU0289835.1 flavin reductase family protein [Saccharothrix longispora]
MQTIRTHTHAGQVAPRAVKDFMTGYFTGVTVVTAFSGSGRPHGLTCNSLVSVTLEPPTLLVCLDQSAGTLAAVRETGTFAVNLMSERGRATAERFASAAPDRFDSVAWERSAHGVPVLVDDALSVAQCAVADLHRVGDHTVVFGRILDIENRPGNPLLYGMRTFSGAPEGVLGAVVPGTLPAGR